METDTTLDIDTWFHALPPSVRHHVHRTYTVIAAVSAATSNGWTPTDLAAECSRDLGTSTNIGGTVLHRLQQAAKVGPPAVSRFETFQRPPCGQCGPGRWLEDPETGAPIGRCECAQEATA